MWNIQFKESNVIQVVFSQVLVTGSIHLVGDVLKLVKRWFVGLIGEIGFHSDYWTHLSAIILDVIPQDLCHSQSIEVLYHTWFGNCWHQCYHQHNHILVFGHLIHTVHCFISSSGCWFSLFSFDYSWQRKKRSID